VFNPGQDHLILPLAEVFEKFGRAIAKGEYSVDMPEYEGVCRTIAYRALEQTSDNIIDHTVAGVVGDG